MLTALQRCHEREGFRTALLTNNFVGLSGNDGMPRDGAMGKLLDLFDVVVESSRAGVRKPDPAIYRIVCDELGVEPSEAVFLDDLGINLKPARAMGMTTIKVVDPAVALAELEAAVGFPIS
jgi:putative hydrolase of the HAD superfamily